jgi:hypothetical protein
MRGDKPFLLGEGAMTDRAEGEKVEIRLDAPSSVHVVNRQLSRIGDARQFRLIVTNDSPAPQLFEARLRGRGKIDKANGKIIRRNGHWVWATIIPANESRTLTYRYRAV